MEENVSRKDGPQVVKIPCRCVKKKFTSYLDSSGFGRKKPGLQWDTREWGSK